MRKEKSQVKNNIRARMSWSKVAMDVFLLEVWRRFFHPCSSQVWNSMAISHGNKITARWCL